MTRLGFQSKLAPLKQQNHPLSLPPVKFSRLMKKTQKKDLNDECNMVIRYMKDVSNVKIQNWKQRNYFQNRNFNKRFKIIRIKSRLCYYCLTFKVFLQLKNK